MPQRTADEITRQAKSNLAFTLRVLPKKRRTDLTRFYAFCRLIDDLADDPNLPLTKKNTGLASWKSLFTENTVQENLPSHQLQADLLEMRDRHGIKDTTFLSIIEGCEMDLQPQSFDTWEDLQNYTYRVASCVGLACLPLFGATHPNAEKFAVTLGHALQLTNILRDVGEDLQDNTRIYLPLSDLAQFQYTQQDLIARVHDSRFLALMNHQARRAETLFREAAELLPKTDHRALLAPRVMARIYSRLLNKMKRDHFHVFTRRYSLSKPTKAALLLRETLRR